MLSSEIATLISGRYVEISMLPLSFKEYVSYTGNTNELAPLQKITDHYRKIILTLDEDPEADYEEIRRINALDWLIGMSD